METRSLAELVTPDQRSVRFSPLGLLTQHVMVPEAAANFLQEIVAEAVLPPTAPSVVTKRLDSVRQAFAHGLFVYEFFTLAASEAELVTEMALRLRFVEFFAGGITLVNTRTGDEAELSIERYDELAAALRRSGSNPSGAGWTINGTASFDGSLRSLLLWARDEGLLSLWLDDKWKRAESATLSVAMSGPMADSFLPAQWEEMTTDARSEWWAGSARQAWENQLLDAVRFVRNFVVHRDSEYLMTPIDAARSITDVALFVTSLWTARGSVGTR